MELDELRKKVYDTLKNENMTINQLSSALQVDEFDIMSCVAYLEINKFVQVCRSRKCYTPDGGPVYIFEYGVT